MKFHIGDNVVIKNNGLYFNGKKGRITGLDADRSCCYVEIKGPTGYVSKHGKTTLKRLVDQLEHIYEVSEDDLRIDDDYAGSWDKEVI